MAKDRAPADELAPYVLEVEFRALGSIEVHDGGRPAALGGPKQRAVLALLLKDVGRVVTTDSLIDGVWGDDPPDAVRNSLHTYISNLRSILGGRIERMGSGYRLDVEPAEVDTCLFEQLLDEARAAMSVNPAVSGQTLRAALALWRGRPYGDLIDVPGLADEIRRLEELRLLAVEARVDADLAIGRHQAVIPELEALAAEHPLREGFRARQMIALYRDGRQGEALRACQRTRQYLSTELGVDPSPELQELEERILQHDPELLSPRDVRTEEVAFLFTDLEASTVLWETRPDDMRHALANHDEILVKAVADAGGRVFKHTGDGMLAAFGTVAGAAQAAAQGQTQLQAADWGALGQLRVRMSVDVGEVDARGDDYFGAPMNRGARMMSAAHGGQIVLSAPAQDQLRHQAGVEIRSLGEHRFKGLGAPQQVYELLVPGLENEFPDLRTDTVAAQTGRQFGDSIRGYEIRERIGVGRFGVVYRAYQPAVGREVAVKVIRPEYANHPAFVRGFEAEARLVARLEHPHIVSLYDFWRDHEGAYLVMPYLAGRSLAGSPYGTLSLERMASIMRQVGSALAYAHRQGVIHRDVKPANILLDADGNAYLADFGIAVRAVEQAGGAIPSSQTYRAPEDRAGGVVDERTDVYSLAAVTAELLTGTTPPPAEMSGLPAQVATTIERGLAAEPAERFGSVDRFLSAFLIAAGAPETVPALRPAVIRNPYKGLEAFVEEDARDFFGRDDEIAALLRMVERHRFVTVVGPSGSGKSSLVRAGLVPALRSGRLSGSHRWLTVTTLPGAHPFDELATALADVATERLGPLSAELRADPNGLLRVAKRLTRDVDGELVLVVDQFEELFSLVGDEETRAAFIDALLAAVQDPHSRLHIVATIRADFFDQPLLDDRLGPVVSTAHLALAVPAPDALLETVEGPAAAAGVKLESGLAQQVVADVREQPGGLPLMQFVLTDLVDRSEMGQVSLAAYTQAGGVTGALSRRATAVYVGLNDADRAVAEQIFLRLVTVSDDADDIRRRVRRSELESLSLAPVSVGRVLDAFGAARLLTFDRDPITRGPTVEVAHEALLREWGHYRRWIDNRREALLIHRRFSLACAEWEAADRSDGHLPGGGRLTQYEEWATEPSVVLSETERSFLHAAIGRRDRQTSERLSRRRTIIGGFAAAALIAVVLAVAAWVQTGNARDQTTLAQERQTAAERARLQADENAARAETQADRASQAEAVASEEAARAAEAASVATARELVLASTIEVDPELSTHLALAAIEAFRSTGDVPSSAVDALRSAAADIRVRARYPGGRFASVSADGSTLATTAGPDNRRIALWDLPTGKPLEILQLDGVDLWSAEFSPTTPELHVEAIYEDRDWTEDLVWNLDTGEWEGPMPVGAKASDPGSYDVSPDGSRVALGLGAVVRIWDRQSATVTFEALFDRSDTSWTPMAFSVDNRLAYVVSEGESASTIQVVDSDGGEGAINIHVPFRAVGMSWSPDGTRLATVNPAGQMAVFDGRAGAQLWLREDLDRARTPVWYAGGTRLVIGGETLFEVFDADTGETIRLIPGTDFSQRYSVIPGTELVAIGGEGEVQVFDLSDGPLPEVGSFVSTAAPEPFTMQFVEGRNELVTRSWQGGHAIMHPTTGATIEEPEFADPLAFENPFGFTAVSRNGLFAAGSDANGQYRLWSTADGSVIYTAPAGWEIRGINDDGSTVVISGAIDDEPSTRLVATVDGSSVADLDAGEVSKVDFTADGTYIVTNNNFEGSLPPIRVWNAVDGTLLAAFGDEPSRDDDGNPADQFSGWWNEFTPDDRSLVIGGYDGTVRVLDFSMIVSGAQPQDALVRRIDAHDNFILFVGVSPDGSMVASSSWDEPAKLWDLETGDPRGEFGTTARTAVAFHPTEPRLYIAEGDTVTVHTLDLDELIDIARSRLTRDMTDAECERYLRRPCDGAST